MLESRKTLQGDGRNFHSIPKKDENSCPTRENDELLLLILVVLLFFAIAVQVDVVLSALIYDLQY
jgi:hypothetical protein